MNSPKIRNSPFGASLERSPGYPSVPGGARGEDQPYASVVTMLAPTLLFDLACKCLITTLVNNISNSFTDLSLFGLRKGGEWIGLENSGNW